MTSVSQIVPDLSSCYLVPPSWQAWRLALAVHLTQSIVGFGVVGFVLFKTLSKKPQPGSRSRSTRTTLFVGTFFAVTLCAAVPICIILLSTRQSSTAEKINWMVPFLLSVFGNCVFFKALTVALGNYPEGADRDLKTWMLWFSSLPEPVFVKGNLQPAPKVLPILLMSIVKTAVCGILVSILRVEQHPFQTTWSSTDGDDVFLDSTLFLLDSLLHLWWLFIFCSFCMDVGVALVAVQGFAAEEPYSRPLLMSRSYKECWGVRWNRPYHQFFKRTVYLPARRAGYDKVLASIFAFVVSGMVHEYNFFVHNYSAYMPGQALLFFLVAGILMVLEGSVHSLLFGKNCARATAVVERIPSFVICFCLILPVLPFYEHFFFYTWLKAGMIEDVSRMLPHVQCSS